MLLLQTRFRFAPSFPISALICFCLYCIMLPLLCIRLIITSILEVCPSPALSLFSFPSLLIPTYILCYDFPSERSSFSLACCPFLCSYPFFWLLQLYFEVTWRASMRISPTHTTQRPSQSLRERGGQGQMLEDYRRVTSSSIFGFRLCACSLCPRPFFLASPTISLLLALFFCSRPHMFLSTWMKQRPQEASC